MDSKRPAFVHRLTLLRRTEELLNLKEETVRNLPPGDLRNLMRELHRLLSGDEVLLQQIQKAANLGYWRIDADGGQMWWSDRMYAILGREAHLGPPDMDRFADLFEDDAADKIGVALREAVEKGTSFDLSLPTRRHGENAPGVRVYGTPQHSPTGGVTGIVGIVMQYAEPPAARPDDSGLDTGLLSVMDIAGIGAIYYDPHAHILMMNKTACGGLDGEPEDFIGHSPGDIFGAEAGAIIESLVYDLLKGGKPARNGETVHATADDRWITVSFSRVGTGAEDAPIVLALHRDITEHMLMDRALRAAREDLTAALDGSHAGMWFVELNPATATQGVLKQTHLSPRMKGFLGFYDDESPDSLVTWLERVHPDDRGRLEAGIDSLISGRSDRYEVEYRGRHRDGSERWLTCRGRLERDAEGHPRRVIGILLDITNRKRAQTQLRESENRYRSTINALDEAVVVVDRDFRVLLANPLFLNLLAETGINERVTGENLFEICPFIDESVRDEYIRVRDSAEPIVTRETNIYNGREMVTETRKVPVIENGEVIRIITLIGDVTEQTRSERALLLKTRAFDASIAAMSTADTEWNITEANPAFLKFFGYDNLNEVIGRPISDFLKNDGEVDSVKAGLQTDGVWEGEFLAVRKDSSTFNAFAMASTLKDSSGRLIGYQSSVIDITERKRSVAAAREHQARLNQILDSALWAVTLTDLGGVVLECNRAAVKLMAAESSRDLIGRNIREFAAPAERDRIAEDIRAAVETGTIAHEEYSLLRLNGESFPGELSIVVIRDSLGHPIQLMEMVRDISRRRRYEIEAKARTEQLTEAQRIAHLGFWTWWLDDGSIEWSEEVCRIMQMEAGTTAFTAKQWTDMIHPDDRELRAQTVRSAIDAAGEWTIEYRLVPADGKIHMVLERGRISSGGAGTPGEATGTLQDITDRVERRVRLRHLTAVLDKIPDAVILTGMNLEIINWNRLAAEIYGATDPTFLGKYLGDIVGPGQFTGMADRVVNELLTAGEWDGGVHRVRQGEIVRTMRCRMEMLRDKQGRPDCVMVVCRDISEQARFETALNEINELYARLFSGILDAVIIFEAKTLKIVDANAVSEKLYGYSRQELKSMTLTDISVDPSAVRQMVETVASGQSIRIPFRQHRRKGGAAFPVEISASAFRQEGRHLVYEVIHDITLRVIHNQQLRQLSQRIETERKEVERKNAALNEILDRIESERREMGRQMMINIERVVMPTVRKLEIQASQAERQLIERLKTGLDEITSPFISKLERRFDTLTPREIEVCDRIKRGLDSKEIAMELNVSPATVKNHRKNIRKKLGIANENVNLVTFLKTI